MFGLVWFGSVSGRLAQLEWARQLNDQFTQRGRFLSKYQQGTITAPWKSVHRLFIITPTGRLGFHSLKPLYYWLETVLADQKQTQKYEGMYHLVSLQPWWNRILDIKIHICTKWQLGDRLRWRDPDSFVFSWSFSDRSRITSQPNIRSTPKWICSWRYESESLWSSD